MINKIYLSSSTPSAVPLLSVLRRDSAEAGSWFDFAIMCGFLYDWSLFCIIFYFCNHLAEEERAGCFTLIAFLLCVCVGGGCVRERVVCLFLLVPLVGL